MLRSVYAAYKNAFSGLGRETWLLSTILLINRSGSMVILFLPVYATESLGFSITRAGLLLSAYGTGSIAGALLGGWLTDKLGFYRVQFWSLMLSGIAFISILFFREFYALCGALILLSIIAESLRPAVMTATAVYCQSPEQTTRANSLNRLAINLGFSIGPTIGGLLAAISFNWVFIADGLTCIAAALAMRLYLPVKKAPPKTKTRIRDSGSSPYRDRNYLIFVVITFFYATAFFQLLTTLSLYYKDEYQLPKQTIGLLMAMNGLVIALFEMVLVYKIEKKMHRLLIAAFGALLTGLSFVMLNWFHGFFILIAAMLLVTFAEMLSLAFMTGYMINRSPAAGRGRYAALYTVAFSAAQIIAPLAGTQIVAHAGGYTTLWYVVGGLCLLVALALRWLKAREG